MKPYYQDEWVQIFHGDCREILPLLPDKSIDLVLTSPPYNKHSASRKSHKTDTWSGGGAAISYGPYLDDMPEAEYQEWQVDIINKCLNILCDRGSFFYNHKNRTVEHKIISPLEWILKSKAVIKQEIIWNRMLIVEIDKIRFYPKTERLYWLIREATQPYFNPDSARLTDIWNIPPSQNKDRHNHSAPFPEELANNCITATTKSGSLVLDPFLGSGTTAYCAKKLNRKCIGIEIEEKYCEIAAKRCSQSVMRLEV